MADPAGGDLPVGHPPMGATTGEALPPGHPAIDPTAPGATGAMGAGAMGAMGAATDDLAWKVPPAWTVAPDTSTMRLATYKVRTRRATARTPRSR